MDSRQVLTLAQKLCRLEQELEETRKKLRGALSAPGDKPRRSYRTFRDDITVRVRALKYLAELPERRARARDIAEALGIPASHIAPSLQGAMQRAEVIRISWGVYALPERPRLKLISRQ